MILLAAFSIAGCLAVSANSDHVLASDLVPVFPEMAGVPADTVIALAPGPGVERIFRASELRMLAARFHLSQVPDGEICFTRQVAPLTPERLLVAMRRTLPSAHIEILETSRQPAPDGEIQFPLAGLRPSPRGAVWVGAIRYAGNRSFSIWARVKVSVKVERVIATADLLPGKPMSPTDVQAVTRDDLPSSEVFPSSAAELIGKWPKVPIRAGVAIPSRLVVAAPDIVHGDSVVVEVRNGMASLKLDAKAESSGSIGDTITVCNPTSKKRFRARVEAKGLVSVDASKSQVNL